MALSPKNTMFSIGTHYTYTLSRKEVGRKIGYTKRLSHPPPHLASVDVFLDARFVDATAKA